jgi:hypothetical protein
MATYLVVVSEEYKEAMSQASGEPPSNAPVRVDAAIAAPTPGGDIAFPGPDGEAIRIIAKGHWIEVRKAVVQ